MQITHLPPQPAPKHVSAQRHSPNLEEHLMAFICHNNQSGFLNSDHTVGNYTKFSQVDPNVMLSVEALTQLDKPTIASYMFKLATTEEISIKELKTWAFDIKRLTVIYGEDKDGKQIVIRRLLRMFQAYDLVARLLGYANWKILRDHIRWENHIPKKIAGAEVKKHFDESKLMVKNRRDHGTIKLKLFMGDTIIPDS